MFTVVEIFNQPEFMYYVERDGKNGEKVKERVICSSNQPVLLSDGRIRNADELVVGDSVVDFFFDEEYCPYCGR